MNLIANIGFNWNGDYERMKAMISELYHRGVRNVALPVFRADKVYREKGQINQLAKYNFELNSICDAIDAIIRKGMNVFPTVSFESAIPQIERMEPNGYHIPMGNIQNEPLLKAIGGTNRLVLLNTAFSAFVEIDDALEWIGHMDAILLHSTGEKPTSYANSLIHRIGDLLQEFMPLEVGLESFSPDYALDFVAMVYRPKYIVRLFDLEDGKGLESHYSLKPRELSMLLDLMYAMHEVNNPVFVTDDGFTQSDLDARRKFMRCKKDDYLLPPTG